MQSTGSTTRAAVQLCLANRDDISKVRQAAYYAKGLIKARYFLIDLPNVLAAGFVDPLRRLQQYSVTGDFPFSSTVAPKTDAVGPSVQPPAYALDAGFRYDLNCLRDPSKDSPREDLLLSPGSQEGLQSIKQLTTLDDGQATALFENLNRRVAFTQGPPGTGKTFLGVAESEVILKSQPQDNYKPIIVVCMTNHALDDFIASLIKRNITKIVRVGNRSTCDWMEKYLLINVSRRVKANIDERRGRFEARSQAENLVMLGIEWAEEFSSEVGIRTLQGYLAKNHTEIANQFEYLDKVGVREAEYRLLTRSSAGYAFKYWITGGDLNSIEALVTTSSEALGISSGKIDVNAHTSVLKVLNMFKEKIADSPSSCQMIWNRDMVERQELLKKWLRDINEWSLCEAFAEIHRRHQSARARSRRLMQELDVRSLLEQKIDIIALTASGCARNWEFLNMLQPHTYLMEEASELTEASTIAALVPSAQHLIKIGDPFQLRPHITSQALCTENDVRYRLDESLFERLIDSIPFSRLNTQRRAHPDLADLLREGDYPYLIDHPSTHNRPDVPGLFSRLYWVHHDVPEDIPDPLSAMAKSCSNRWEADFISNTVKYLIERQGFRYNTITILTPYNGQVALFVRCLKSFCNVVLTKGDKEALVDAGMLEMDELDSKSATSFEVGAMIRVTTVDNYQGEENDVVFFSPVRSNVQGKAGFLKNQNRVNVAISRARNGFYVVGNSTLLETIPQWTPIVSKFKHKSACGRELPLKPCSKHYDDDDTAIIGVAHPDKFQYIPACQEPCLQELPCGHLCSELCHLEEMHKDGRMPCTELCGKTLPCGHQCQKLCGEKCTPCTAFGENIIMPCGHLLKPLCSTDMVRFWCTREKGQVLLDCGHIKTIKCADEGKEVNCDEDCGRLLECGHKCVHRCSECNHDGCCLTCEQICGRDLPCGHKCITPCHGSEVCPTCLQPCLKACSHGNCKLPCAIRCDPCVKEGQRISCPHQEKAILCSLPGTFIPCSQPCSHMLSCGLHICPSICGEPCPETCLECRGQRSKEPTYTLPCQHTFTVKELDKSLGLEDLYSFDSDGKIWEIKVQSLPKAMQLQCPTCGSSISGCPRYALARQLLDGQDIIGRLCAKMGRQLRQVAKSTMAAEDRLFLNLTELCTKIKPGPLAVRHNQEIMNKRMTEMIEVQREAMRTRDNFVRPLEESIIKFARMLNNGELFPVPVLSFKLRFDRVYYRCRFLIARFLSMVTVQLRKTANKDEYIGLLIEVLSSGYRHLSGDIAALDQIMLPCQQKNLKRLEVELIILKTSLVVVARNTGLEIAAIGDDLKRASTLCAAYPNSAGCLLSNVREANSFIMSGVSSLALDDMHKVESRDFWEKLGNSECGGPSYCGHGHPFSPSVFPKGCPECGDERKR